jgi:hypothetical protein
MHALYDNVELAGHGLTARMLPVFVPSQKGMERGYATEIPADLLVWYREHIRQLLKIKRPVPAVGENTRTFHTLVLSSSANARIRRYSSNINEQIRNGQFEKLPAFGAKLAGHAVRLAGAIHLMTHTEPQSEEIDDRSMQAGVAWAEYFRVHAEAAFIPEARYGIAYAHKILNWIKRHNRLTFTERDAQHGIGRCVIAQIRAGIAELEKCNYLRTYIANEKLLCVVHPSAHTLECLSHDQCRHR